MKIKIKLSSGKELELSAEEYKEVQDFFTTKEAGGVPYIPYTPYIPWNPNEPSVWYSITYTDGIENQPIIMEAVKFPNTENTIHIYSALKI